ncbi:MAG: type I-B CRISPR-associated protein Cas7/Cst2/DevR [Metasolibacillus sp.]|uniref:type I-B CRISPR-associated protein Cas7/Cst2/DevR n=1 Tax=Metasolibacillus sp. TaxID=2703680 RepID=UPI0025CC6004|nr:type I-B CRISPR-associated protein Cas7/Cst2/DevR [Metasolibacillus sp.]MCT6942541.1 type I-B CRISPR-associated protein Cas7/Cst2/DevR [Metasolibacillus sp.]
MSKALTLTTVIEAGSLNYGEGFSNISELKKFNRADGNTYTFASRQSIRYDIVRLGNELFGWNLDTVSKEKGTLQFKDAITIEDSVEMDLFGYLKTGKQSLKRAAVARLSHTVSLEPYAGDMEFLTNMGMAERNNENANLANIENHISYYTYTVTLDLDKVGIDQNSETELANEERFKRVQQFLEILKLLSRNIRGRQENLTPLFAIGGVYPVANPFFQGRIQLQGKDLRLDRLSEINGFTFGGQAVKNNTHIGLTTGTFSNEKDIQEAFTNVVTVEQFFGTITKEVADYYGVAYEVTKA